MYDSHHGGYGDLTVKGVFEHSSNVGIFKIVLNAYEEAPQKFIDGLYSLGINKPLGIEIKGEKPPYIKDTHDPKWSKLSLPWMAIGYELTMTPLQVLTLYNAVANNGKMVKPMFVKEIRKTNKVIKKFDTQVIKEKIAPDDVIADARSMCEGVVTEGTATLLRNSPYPVAGKTGTAQIYTKGTYNNNSYIASFVGYFPADNPKYSCMVVIYNPRHGIYYASQVAVPVFKDIADKIYATEIDIQRNEPADDNFAAPASKIGLCSDIASVYNHLDFHDERFASLDGKWIYSYGNDSTLAIRERVINEGVMPNVKGLNLRDAVYMLEQLGLRVNFEGSGKVVSQSIMPNSRIVRGSSVFLTLRN
jgi:cell division protein FtsI (penicillin-binding protein 3)